MNQQDTSSDFHLFHTYANHIADARIDWRAVAELVTSQGLFNGMLFWVDHHKEKVTPPPIEWFKENDLAVMFEFYTNDHYAVSCARMEGFGDDLTAYNEHLGAAQKLVGVCTGCKRRANSIVPLRQDRVVLDVDLLGQLRLDYVLSNFYNCLVINEPCLRSD